MHIEVKNGEQQRDFKEGCLEIASTDSQQTFELGRILQILSYNGVEAVEGNWAQGKFIRVPLVPKKK